METFIPQVNKKKAYLAGPMSNIPYFNFPVFLEAAKELRAKNYEVFCPAEKDIETYGDFWKSCPKGSHDELDAKEGPVPTYREVLKVDLNWILDNAEVIALLPGWEKSKGALTELALARCLNLEEIYL